MGRRIHGTDARVRTPAVKKPVREPTSPALASRIGNRAFAALVQRAAPPATGPTPVAADPAADAKALLAETPKSDVDHATWLLKAVDAGFATVWSSTRTELEGIRDGKEVEGLTPSKTEMKMQGLLAMYDLARAAASRWAATPTDPKKPVTLGSFIRGSTGRHAGKAIDVPRGMDAGTIPEVVGLLSDLSVASYGIGLPYSGDYFDPADDIEAKKTAAEAAAPKDGTPAPVADAVQLDTSHIYRVEWDAAQKKWATPAIERAGAAYTKLKSAELKEKLEEMRNAGSTLTIFPDRPGHVHLDRR